MFDKFSRDKFRTEPLGVDKKYLVTGILFWFDNHVCFEMERESVSEEIGSSSKIFSSILMSILLSLLSFVEGS